MKAACGAVCVAAVLAVEPGCSGAQTSAHSPVSECSRIDSIRWILGRWCTSSTEPRRLCEEWRGPGQVSGPGCGPNGEGEFCDPLLGAEIIADGTMVGRAWRLISRGERVSSNERFGWPLAMAVANGSVQYTETEYGVRHAPLHLVRCTSTSAVFEASGLQFPTRITYRLLAPHALVRQDEGVGDASSAQTLQLIYSRMP